MENQQGYAQKKTFGLKVLAGILIGIVVGFLLLFFLPTGVQPNDRLLATTPDGAEYLIAVPENQAGVVIGGLRQDPETLEFTEQPELISPEVELIGQPLEDPPLAGFRRAIGIPTDSALQRLNEGSTVSFTDIKVEERAGVTNRPWPTEIVYIAGQIFIRLLRMLVVPLIIATVLIGIASLGNIRKLGSIGKQAAVWYIGTMLAAVLIGIVFVNLYKPGVPLQDQAGFGQAGFEAGGEPFADQTVAGMILKVIPTNPFEAIATMDIVGLLFFVIIVAIAMLKLGKKRVAPVYNFFEGLHDIVFVLVGWVMALAPIGIAALIANTIGTQDVSFVAPLLESLGRFFLTVLSALAGHFILLMVLLKTVGKYSPLEFLKNMGPAMATAFGTSSSSATLPVTMRGVEGMGVSRRISNFTIPVGATLNMDGTALFEAVAVMFFAQAFAQDFGFGLQIVVALTSVVAAIGAAGIPSAGLVTMTIVLSAVGLPTSKMQILWAIDRPLDMTRTMINVVGDSTMTRVVQTLNPEIKQAEDDLHEEYEEVEPEASRDAPA
jgi:Na+/H+-dicarboxylate symporter